MSGEGEVDYGNDCAGFDDLDEYDGDLSGVELVTTDLCHRLKTSPGRLIDDDDYGLGVDRWLSEGVNLSTLKSSKEALARIEALKDERIQSATATVDMSADGSTIELTVEGASAYGPFRLVVPVGEAYAATTRDRDA